jgi:hypothetical protein
MPEDALTDLAWEHWWAKSVEYVEGEPWWMTAWPTLRGTCDALRLQPLQPRCGKGDV